jgi:rRNA maturation protein Nop10
MRKDLNFVGHVDAHYLLPVSGLYYYIYRHSENRTRPESVSSYIKKRKIPVCGGHTGSRHPSRKSKQGLFPLEMAAIDGSRADAKGTIPRMGGSRFCS